MVRAHCEEFLSHEMSFTFCFCSGLSRSTGPQRIPSALRIILLARELRLLRTNFGCAIRDSYFLWCHECPRTNCIQIICCSPPLLNHTILADDLIVTPINEFHHLISSITKRRPVIGAISTDPCKRHSARRLHNALVAVGSPQLPAVEGIIVKVEVIRYPVLC